MVLNPDCDELLETVQKSINNVIGPSLNVVYSHRALSISVMAKRWTNRRREISSPSRYNMKGFGVRWKLPTGTSSRSCRTTNKKFVSYMKNCTGIISRRTMDKQKVAKTATRLWKWKNPVPNISKCLIIETR